MRCIVQEFILFHMNHLNAQCIFNLCFALKSAAKILYIFKYLLLLIYSCVVLRLKLMLIRYVFMIKFDLKLNRLIKSNNVVVIFF